MKRSIVLALTISSMFFSSSVFANENAAMNSDTALQKLITGNNRYVSAKLEHPDESVEKRKELTKGQHPFAVVLSCADSRVPPELVFDQGLGDLFVIRVAGNVTDDDIIGSIEYAVEHLGTSLVVVLGHEKCGAVTAAVQGTHQASHIQCLIDAIQPAVDKAKHEKGDLLDNAIKDNVQIVVNELKKSEPVLSELLNQNKVKIIGAYYHLDTGKVDFSK